MNLWDRLKALLMGVLLGLLALGFIMACQWLGTQR